MAKKIVIDVRLLSKGGVSGIEEYTRNLVSSVLELDKSNTYTLFYNGLRRAMLPSEWDHYPKARIVSKSIPNKLFDASSRFLDLPKVENLCGGGNLVVSPHFNIVSTNLPQVVTFHDLSFLHHPDFFSIKQRLWHWLQGYRETANRASHCIAVSEFTKHDLMEFLEIPEERISVIYSGVHQSFRPLEKDSRELQSFRKKHNLERPFLLYLGTLEPRKNIPALIRAFDVFTSKPAFRDFELVIAGRVGWLAREIFKEAKSARASPLIRFYGSPELHERVYLYNSAEAFAYPSFFEGFGFQPLEAQACGIPVVASCRTSLPEIISTSAKLIDPWSVDALASALEEVLSNNSERQALIQAGLRNAKCFSWQKTAEKTIAVYNKL